MTTAREDIQRVHRVLEMTQDQIVAHLNLFGVRAYSCRGSLRSYRLMVAPLGIGAKALAAFENRALGPAPGKWIRVPVTVPELYDPIPLYRIPAEVLDRLELSLVEQL